MTYVHLFQQVVEIVEDGTAMRVREGRRLVSIAGMHADELRIQVVDAVKAFDMQVDYETDTDEACPNWLFFMI